MLTVENGSTVIFKFLGNSAPVIKELGISEKDAVNKKKRVFCLADLLIFPFFVSRLSYKFKFSLTESLV